ncbi:MAG: hypothetical protein R3344_02485 [Acidobacteriota bacterium]|nr:hypothetical protein [Acidobacteriota bacterium]
MRFFGLVLAGLLLAALFSTTGLSGQDTWSTFGSRGDGDLSRIGRDDEGDDDSSDDDDGGGRIAFARYFVTDPQLDPDAVSDGAALDRLEWQPDDAVFPGDAPGSLTALYDASLPAGLFGFRLPAALSVDDTFTAAAAFVIHSEGFSADPNGFFQISWGLWNSTATGLDRTGSFTSFAADTFELIEFDWFPNVSPFFGGPFVSPSVFGVEAGGDAFNNFSSLFGLQVSLPFDVPLLAILEHRPEVDALVLTVHRIVDSDHVVPVDAAVGVARLDFLAARDYDVDVIGLTLWNDGFGGATPAVVATLDFHALTAISGLPDRPEQMLRVGPADDDDSSDDDSDDD